MTVIDLTGRRFGRLVVRERAANKGRDVCWVCVCLCGATAVIRGAHLRRGYVKSCGCLRAEQNPVLRQTHGLTGSPVYRVLQAAYRRCTFTNDPRYADYGGRGIEFRLPRPPGEAVQALFEAIGPRPDGMTLDRIDNDGHYEIGNLRWATPAEQASNQRPRRAVAA